VPPSLLAGAGVEERDRYEQAIRVLQANGETVDIMNDTASLMYVLSRHEMLKIRVYVLLPQSHEARLPDIRAAVARDLDG